ncbi:hypothetical protein M413DRAFT_446072 [Hebeloma cylindrosporum]|uniref:Uncharacterized protein n=1 Tax=Hebeloma cylindrosporum TaxID=76867 RepID=A0A0C3BVL7_HEBCY|nr:hypothetical protein M413DRAFT_446072 [Hebeloma cylindrosporum h7]
MNARPTIATCMDNHDHKSENMTSRPNGHDYSQMIQCSIFSLHNMADIRKNHFYSLAEISLSPAKYSLFQILGFKFFEKIENAATPPFCLSLKSAAIVGVLGGTLLSLLYLLLLLKRHHLATDELDVISYYSYIQALCKEIAYSGLAGVIGASAIGRCSAHELSYFAISGILGPILFLVLMFGVVGLVIGVVRGMERVKYRFL